jgi:hypothetical protein
MGGTGGSGGSVLGKRKEMRSPSDAEGNEEEKRWWVTEKGWWTIRQIPNKRWQCHVKVPKGSLNPTHYNMIFNKQHYLGGVAQVEPPRFESASGASHLGTSWNMI